MKKLYLLRHAKAEPGSKVVGDSDRTLSARGREACAAMGVYMKKKSYAPALVLCSPSARTRQTLELVAQAAGVKPKHTFEDMLYLATAEEILRVAQNVEGEPDSLMIVGHNPGMHHVALLLAAPGRTQSRLELELKYPTGALAVLEMKCACWRDLGVGKGTLLDFVTPESVE